MAAHLGGLVRFDGVRFVLMDLAIEGQGPTGEPVGAICRGVGGELLVRTTTNGVFVDYLPPNPLPDGAIRTLFESRRHEVFVGADDFIYQLEGNTVKMLARHTGWVGAFFEDEVARYGSSERASCTSTTTGSLPQSRDTRARTGMRCWREIVAGTCGPERYTICIG